MPVIKTEKYNFEGKIYLKKTKVSADGLFRINLPDEVAMATGDFDAEDKTCDGAIKKWDEIIKKYRESKTTKRKVIVYEIDYSGYIWGDPKLRKDYDEEKFKNYDSVCILNKGRSTFQHMGDGMMVKIKARVYIEEKRSIPGREDRYKYCEVDKKEQLPGGLNRPELPSHGRPVEHNIMDWTPERHQFFVKFYDAMARLIIKIDKLMEDNEKFKAIANNGKFLLEEDAA